MRMGVVGPGVGRAVGKGLAAAALATVGGGGGGDLLVYSSGRLRTQTVQREGFGTCLCLRVCIRWWSPIRKKHVFGDGDQLAFFFLNFLLLYWRCLL